MPYHKLYYHVVWSTKYRAHTLTPGVEAQLFRYMREKVEELGGVVLAVNGWVDHVHLVVRIPASISVSEFVGQVKGYATATLNRQNPHNEPVYWQTEYGAFTVDHRNLARIIRYVERQKAHHRKM